MKQHPWQTLSLLTFLTLALTGGEPANGQDMEAGKPTTSKERLPLTHAPTSPTIDVPVVEELDEPELPENTIAQPTPPKPPTPPKVGGTGRESPTTPVDQALQFMDNIRKETPNLLKAAPGAAATPAASTPPAPPAPVKPVTPPPAKPTVEKTKEPPPPNDNGSEKRGYLVQVGAMSQVENALTLVEKCQDKGFAAFHQPPDEVGGGLHRILIGPFASKAEADDVASKWREIFKGKTIIQRK